jgi:hypothetical protein
MYSRTKKHDQSKDKALIDVPFDANSHITSFLPGHEQPRIAQLNKDFYRDVTSDVINPTSFYYAVGTNIDLYKDHYSYSNCSYPKRRGSIPRQEIVSSLGKDDKNILLFPDYGTAKKYAYLSEVNTYNSGLDLFIPQAAPGVFIVELVQKGPYNKISITAQVKEDIPECPIPPSAIEMKTPAFKTPLNNVKIHFAKFDGRLFQCNKTEGRFADIWSKAVSTHHDDLKQSAMAGVSALMNSYFTWYSIFTRHNQPQVRQILNKIRQNPSIKDLQEFIATALQQAMNNKAINKNGHYVQLLKFANIQLNRLERINHLPEISNYMQHGEKRDFH